MKRLFACGALVLVGTVAPVAAQSLDFGAWCSEVAHFDADRCIEARPEDRMAYERYVSKIDLFYNEVQRRDEARRQLVDRVNRMGDVTPDQTRDSYRN